MQKLRPRPKTKLILIFKGFGDSLSEYGRIFELFDKIGFRTLAVEKKTQDI